MILNNKLREPVTRRFTAILAALMLMIALTATASAQQDFTLTTLEGQSVSLAGLRGKVVVMLFSGVQDPQCHDAAQALASLAERYQGKPVSIYLVSVNSPSDASDAS